MLFDDLPQKLHKKGKGAWEPQYESKECKVCKRDGRGSTAVPAQPWAVSYVTVTLIHQSAMHSMLSLHIHSIICYDVQR